MRPSFGSSAAILKAWVDEPAREVHLGASGLWILKPKAGTSHHHYALMGRDMAPDLIHRFKLLVYMGRMEDDQDADPAWKSMFFDETLDYGFEPRSLPLPPTPQTRMTLRGHALVTSLPHEIEAHMAAVWKLMLPRARRVATEVIRRHRPPAGKPG